MSYFVFFHTKSSKAGVKVTLADLNSGAEFFFPHLAASGILVPQPEIEPTPHCIGNSES